MRNDKKIIKEERKLIHLGFEIGLILKVFNAVLEIIGGFLFLFYPWVITKVVGFIIRGELSEDPRDVVVGIIIKWMDFSLSNIRILLGFYLLVIGIAKIGFVIALWKKKLNAYVVYEIILALFVGYQIYRYLIRHETFILIVTLIDVFVMVVVWLEYLRIKRRI